MRGISTYSCCTLQAKCEDKYVGAIVCKMDSNYNEQSGYIAMLAVDKAYRKRKIGIETALVFHSIACII